MNQRLGSSIVLFIVTLTACLGLFGHQTHAAGGVTIAPPFQEITILQGQSSLPQSFSVSNNSDNPVTFTLKAVDMGALDDTGGVAFSGLTANYQQKYGLAKWVQLDQPSVSIEAHMSQAVPFTIINDDTLSPGGHYGAIVITFNQQSTAGSNAVGLNPQAATLLFVHKVGGDIYKLNFANGAGSTSWWELPKQLTIKLRNDGNVHVVPRGVVTLIDPHGHVIGRGIINPESSLILPEHTRDYTIVWQQVKRVMWPGTYTAKVDYRFDGSDAFQTAEYKIRYINLPFFMAVFIIGVAIVWIMVRILPLPHLRRRLPRLKRNKEKKPKPVDRQKFMSMRTLDQKRNIKAVKKTKSTVKNPTKSRKK